MPVAVLAVGTAIRLDVYLRRGSFWIDEARLGLNIARRSFAQLGSPLAYDQAAPLLFLWAQKAAITLWGVNEFALRLLPLLAGITTIGVVYLIGETLAGRTAGALAAFLAAIAPTMVEYSNENKQYSIEALITAVLLLAYLALLEHPSKRRAYLLVLTGAVSVWLSIPAVFMLATLAAMSVFSSRRLQRQINRVLALGCALWLVSFGVAFDLTYRQTAGSAYMARYWSPAFLVPAAPGFWVHCRDAALSLIWGILIGRQPVTGNNLGAFIFVTTVTLFAIAGLLTGAIGAAKYRAGTGASLLISPLLLATGASMAGKYPFVPRTLLFAAPLLYVLVGVGLRLLLDPGAGRSRVAVGLLAATATVFLPLALMMRDIVRILPREHVRPLVDHIRAERKPGDIVYVSAGALPSYAFYTTDWNDPDTARLSMFERAGHSGGAAFQNASARRAPVAPTEGLTLVWRGREGLELFGVPTGIEGTAVGVIGLSPDSGWAAHEASRIVFAMGPRNAWIVLSSMDRSEFGLVQELQKNELRVRLFPSGLTSLLINARH